jgi:hypothetical protein
MRPDHFRVGYPGFPPKEVIMPGDLSAWLGASLALTIVLVCGGIVLSLGITIGAIVLVRRAFMPNQRVLTEGISGEATILQVRQTGVMVNYQPQVVLTLDVRISDWEPYQAETTMVIPIVNVPQFQPGAVFPVKVDPENRSKVVLDVYGR